jgi:hypothetical protein
MLEDILQKCMVASQRKGGRGSAHAMLAWNDGAWCTAGGLVLLPEQCWLTWCLITAYGLHAWRCMNENRWPACLESQAHGPRRNRAKQNLVD